MGYNSSVRLTGLMLGCALLGGCNFRIDPVSLDPANIDAGVGDASAGNVDLAGAEDLTMPPPGDLAHSGAFLDVTNTLTPPAVDLTFEGTADWGHWGFNAASDFDHKAAGNSLISNFSQVGVNIPTQFSDGLIAYRWSDGATGNSHHAKTIGNGTTTGVYVLSGGFKITAPADTSVRRLRVYVGQLQATGQIDVSLSDNSAPAVSDASHAATGTPINVEYVITYAASSPGQTVTVQWTVNSANLGGTITLQSATLQNF
ncbi:MAG: hypothetical protein JWN44_3298 [Myxococcales bacterium]|nr:hypothetical protein [Myxococcales bacterium]